MKIPVTKCLTPSCESLEVEALDIGPPQILPGDDLIRYEYEGRCPLCGGTRFGAFWLKRDHLTQQAKTA